MDEEATASLLAPVAAPEVLGIVTLSLRLPRLPPVKFRRGEAKLRRGSGQGGSEGRGE